MSKKSQEHEHALMNAHARDLRGEIQAQDVKSKKINEIKRNLMELEGTDPVTSTARTGPVQSVDSPFSERVNSLAGHPNAILPLSGRESARFVAGMLTEEKQVQPTGIDLTVGEVMKFEEKGIIGYNESTLPKHVPVESDGYGYNLLPGVYLVRLAETVTVTPPFRARVYPRTTLLRCGCSLGSGMFDPGYRGRPVVLLIVFRETYIETRARICNIEFYPAVPGPEYDGHYQGEGLSK